MTADKPFMSTSLALMYHALGEAVGPAADAHYTVTVPRFSEQLALCTTVAGAAVSARDWLAGRPGVILTFDDGHQSNHHIGLPLLLAAGATADFFVNPAQVGTTGFATWAELREMAEAEMSIQSHGLDHSYFLTELSPLRLREDLRRARLEIEEHVGRPVTLLAPAGGRAPSNLTQVAEEVGYTHVLTSRPGGIRRGQDRTMCRLAVTAQLDLPALESCLRGGWALLGARVRYSVLDVAKRLAGDKIYQSIRRRLLGTATS
jgi:peptidoglycan/xylan/chitin deacetylase (PgdA/CDA1 family)